MARLVGLILMLVGIYLGVVVYTEGADAAFGGIFASADEADFEDGASTLDDAEQQETAAREPERPAGAPTRMPITSRVREKVQRTMDERAERIGAN